MADFTCLATGAGLGYAVFVIDVFARRIVGWRVTSSMRPDLVLEALGAAAVVARPAGRTWCITAIGATNTCRCATQSA